MAINPYFNFHNSTPEQALINSLVQESIRRYGFDINYLPRKIINRDAIYKEDPASEYQGNFVIDMYLESVDGFQGDGQFLSKFGIEIRHQAIWCVSIKTWNEITDGLTGFSQTFDRPLEGDLIYWDKDNKLMEIKKVDQYSLFYQTGALQTYRLTCEMFEYSSEIFNTGLPAVDQLSNRISVSTTEQGSVVSGNPVFNSGFSLNNANIAEFTDNVELEDAAADLVDFSVDNPFSENF